MRLLREVFTFTDNLPSGVMVFSPDGAAIYANSAARALLGNMSEVAAPLDYFLTETGQSLAVEQHPVAVSLRKLKPSGWSVLGVQRCVGHAPVWLRVQASPVLNDAGAVKYVIVSLEDATEEWRLRLELQERDQRLLALDATTSQPGMCGRQEAHVLLARAVVTARDSMGPLAVCLLDLDMFKRLNQAFGRTCGDEVLLHVAESLSASMGQGESFTRIGGGEFLVIMPGLTLRDAMQTMNRFREQLSLVPVSCSGRPVSISGGLAMLREDEDAPALLERADSLLYLAKLDGRNRIVSDSAV